jgi:CxxC-x17-CxxC domain-containing protein
MFQGNWKCSGCGATISELPFEPRSEDGLMCRECHQKQRGEKRAPAGDRKMYSGEWTCSGCGAPINELPFEPRDTSNLKCKACFSKSRA